MMRRLRARPVRLMSGNALAMSLPINEIGGRA